MNSPKDEATSVANFPAALLLHTTLSRPQKPGPLRHPVRYLAGPLTLLQIDLKVHIHRVKQWRGETMAFRPQQQVTYHLIGFDIKALG